MKRYVLVATAMAFAALSWGSGLRAAQPQGARRPAPAPPQSPNRRHSSINTA